VNARPMSRLRRALASGLGLAVASLCLTSCFSGLDLSKDARVQILNPGVTVHIDEVKLPFVMRWSTSIPSSSHLRYAVFFDSNPMGPGQTFRALVGQDDPCKFQPGCPDASWLAQHQIQVTSTSHVDVTDVALLPGEVPGGDGTSIHTATLILLGPGDVRDGESSWTVEFRIDRGL
jgi:hypothetical protein